MEIKLKGSISTPEHRDPVGVSIIIERHSGVVEIGYPDGAVFTMDLEELKKAISIL